MYKSFLEIRQIFLNYFINKNHQLVNSSSLIPKNDSTLMFTNAGMNQFKNIFLGIEQPKHINIVTAQRCVRAGGKHNDLNNIGYTRQHHTFFEMLGNFSFGGYYKLDAIHFAWQLLTNNKLFAIPKNKLLVTVNIHDTFTIRCWLKLGLSNNQLILVGNKKQKIYHSNNFWYMGEFGPCGPCTEIFYYLGNKNINNYLKIFNSKENNENFLELWNLVFIQFNKQNNNIFLPLNINSVDTGMGLERITSVLQSVNSCYEIDLFKSLIAIIIKKLKVKNFYNSALYIIADHIRTCVFIISDGVFPSNNGRGYVLRKIIRRAVHYGRKLGIKYLFLYKLVIPLIKIMKVKTNNFIISLKNIMYILKQEEQQYNNTINKGKKIINKIISKLNSNLLSGKIIFYLYDTYGVSLDIIKDICNNSNIKIDELEFKKEVKKRKELILNKNKTSINTLLNNYKKTKFIGYDYIESLSIVQGIIYNYQNVNEICYNNNNNKVYIILNQTPFYGESGGQVGDQGKILSINVMINIINTKKYGDIFIHEGIIEYGKLKIGMEVIALINYARRNLISINHTATHMLYAALKKINNTYIKQYGSYIDEYHLRFDVISNTSLKNYIPEIENIINQQIRTNLPVITYINDFEYTKTSIVLSSNIKHKNINNNLRSIKIGNISYEDCGGTHVKFTKDINLFCIINELGIAKGVRRLEAITNEVAFNFLREQKSTILKISELIKSNKKSVFEQTSILVNNYKVLKQEIINLEKQYIISQVEILRYKIKYYLNNSHILVEQINCSNIGILINIVKLLKKHLNSLIIVLFTKIDNTIYLVVGITNNIIKYVQANNITKYLIDNIGGKGGGTSNISQIVIHNIDLLPSIINTIHMLLSNKKIIY
ncbi:MAG: alanine--tRNA ligase [Candidatus Lightella neohaematopini]|nr:alanine--tRNA ligase [Candidatus Lightella neohaematopini]